MISPEMLRRFSCFAPVSEETLKALAMIARETVVPKGTRLFGEGDPATEMSIVVEGEVDIQQTIGAGELRTVDTLVGGDLLGWPALVAPYRVTCIAIACTDTRLIKIEAQRLRELCEQDPQLGYRLTTQICRLLADRLDATRLQLASLR
jgi:CRP/FNR family transcriptional regulator, cyclic AMP receptor protein